ncbi:MAG: putative 2OG-Fe(II) oxygenase [Pseudomonadota bacterium]
MSGSNMQADAAALHSSGIAAVKRGQLAEGRAMLERAAQQQPNVLQFQGDLAQVQLMAGDEASAIKTLQICLKLNPGLTPFWLNLGILQLRADRIDEAGECFQKAIDGDARLADAHGGLGVVRQRQKRLPEAAEAFEKAAALSPQDAELRSNLAGALQEIGENDRAIAAFEEAIRLAPDRAALHTHLGVILHEVRGAEAGLPHYDRALGLHPGDARTLAAKRSALVSLGRDEEAAAIFDFDALITTVQLGAAPGYRDMAAFNEALAAHAVSHPSLISDPLGRTTRGGGQTGQLLEGEAGPVTALEGLLRQEVDAYFADPARARHPFRPHRPATDRLDVWATVLDSGGYQDPHIHPSGVLSGVYYVQLPETGDAGALEFGRPPAPFTLPDPEVMVVRPEPGLLVLFPSFFWHRTIPFPGEGRRISIAFDLTPAG